MSRPIPLLDQQPSTQSSDSSPSTGSSHSLHSSSDTPPSPTELPSILRFEIPVQEFSPRKLSSQSTSTPPTRLLSHNTTRSSSPHWRRRLADAEASRNASLASMTHRCRAHMQHVANVVATVEASRRADIAAKNQQLSSSLQNANERRKQILRAKAPEPTEDRARRARSARTRVELQRLDDAAYAEEVRKEAAARRSRYISERQHRASRFSPPLQHAESTLNADTASNKLVTFDSPASTMASSTDTDDENQISKRLSFRAEQFGPEGCLPAAAADFLQDCEMTCELTIDDQQDDCLVNHSQERTKQEKTKAVEIISSYILLWKGRVAMLAAGVIGQSVADYTFNQVTQCMENEHSLKAIDLVLRAIEKQTDYTNPNDIRKNPNDRRILLCCMLMALHPKSVMEQKSFSSSLLDHTSSQELFTLYCARRMLLCLQNGTLSAIRDAWFHWRHVFLQWKRNDSEKLLNAMIEDAVATEGMRLAVSSRFTHSLVVDDVHHSLQGSHTSHDAAKKDYAVWEEQISLKQEKIREAVSTLAGSQGIAKLDAALSAAKHVKSEHLVHEILLDLPALIQRIRSPAQVPNQEWEQMYHQLSANPPHTDILARRIADISHSLNSMIPQSFSMDHTTRPIDLDVDFAVNFVVKAADGLKRCQAEAYDETLQIWLEQSVTNLQSAGSALPSAVVKVMQELTRFVRTVQVDVLSFRVRHSAPIVEQYGPAWERSHFQGHIVSGKFNEQLPRTSAMLKHSFINLLPDFRISKEQIIIGEPRAARIVIINGILQLMTQLEITAMNELPEVCHLDHERITILQNDLQRCTVLACLHNFGKQFLASKGVTLRNNEFEELVQITAKEESGLREMESTFVSWIKHEANRGGISLSTSDESFLSNLLKGLGRPEDELFALMHGRVQKAIMETTLNSINRNSGSSSAASNSSSRSHRILGLDCIDFLVRDVSQRLSKLVLHIVRIHGATLLKLFKQMK